jgi:hypothetical protein
MSLAQLKGEQLRQIVERKNWEFKSFRNEIDSHSIINAVND